MATVEHTSNGQELLPPTLMAIIRELGSRCCRWQQLMSERDNPAGEAGFDNRIDDLAFEVLSSYDPYLVSLVELRDSATSDVRKNEIVKNNRRLFGLIKEYIYADLGISRLGDKGVLLNNIQELQGEYTYTGMDTLSLVFKELGLDEEGAQGLSIQYPSRLFKGTTIDLLWQQYLIAVEDHVKCDINSLTDDYALKDATRRLAHNALARALQDVMYSIDSENILDHNVYDLGFFRQLFAKMRDKSVPKSGENELILNLLRALGSRK